MEDDIFPTSCFLFILAPFLCFFYSSHKYKENQHYFWCLSKISTQYIVYMLKNVDFIEFLITPEIIKFLI